MSSPDPTAANGALKELLEVSPQIDAAVILERDSGQLLASAPAEGARKAAQIAPICIKLLAAADQARTELGREPVAQIEVASSDGHLFVVADPRWIVAAVTSADPTVGLVFYDLKTALRSVREALPASSNGSGPAAAATGKKAAAATSKKEAAATAADSAPSTTTPDATSTGDDEAPDDASQGSGRWRRRKS